MIRYIISVWLFCATQNLVFIVFQPNQSWTKQLRRNCWKFLLTVQSYSETMLCLMYLPCLPHRAVSSPTQIHIDTDWEPTTCRSLSTVPTGPVWPTISVMVQCVCLITKVGHSPACVSLSARVPARTDTNTNFFKKVRLMWLKNENFSNNKCCVFECGGCLGHYVTDYQLIPGKDAPRSGWLQQALQKRPCFLIHIRRNLVSDILSAFFFLFFF